MKIPAVKYMRDFYPEDMYLRLTIEDAWRRASENAGFQPWDAPIVEHLELYTRKSGDEIVKQLYTLRDQGDRDLAIRPEMTPSLARMISERQASLARPIKWYCIARMCRYERKQRGRLREFFQWNVDVLGEPGPVADAEVISVALDGMCALGLTAGDLEVRINSRLLMAALLRGIGIPEELDARVYAVTDKRGKIDEPALAEMYAELGLPADVLARLTALMQCESLNEVRQFVEQRGVAGCEPSLKQLDGLFHYLDCLGKAEFCRYDIGIVRGLAYYTGPVFEIFDRRSELRALCGGGRYDRLLEMMGGQPMPAVGFGLGDVVLGELLKDVGKLPGRPAGVEFFVLPLDEERVADALRIVRSLRTAGLSADFTMKPANLQKMMKRASDAAARRVVFVGGRELEQGAVRVRNMADGQEKQLPLDQFLANPAG